MLMGQESFSIGVGSLLHQDNVWYGIACFPEVSIWKISRSREANGTRNNHKLITCEPICEPICQSFTARGRQ